ncbi:hypothetical protein LSTR_LSTR008975 [Laodelphax striatellus]|uniref:Cation-transporting P-type ATPase C-terminal domain-containing protein n=1 Tax=Laodelphax striatellus TaxID=195883 RepID=A0A482WKS8_LAOST|nr:hypothetical protein LSTR_LSTR008975 [Laodelphax striatellus]
MEPAEDNDKRKEKKGLSTQDALLKLSSGITEILNEHEEDRKRRSKFSFISKVLHHSSEDSLLCWTSLLILVLEALLMIAVSLIENAATTCRWLPANYPHVCSPYSPCITLQWTYRDGRLVNVPWALLVEGDLVLIRPGQPAPGHCAPVIVDTSGSGGELRAGEVYSPVPGGGSSLGGTLGDRGPSARQPLASREYTLVATPFLANLRQMLSQHHRPPPTYHHSARRMLVVHLVEQLMLPFVLISIVGVGIIRQCHLVDSVGSGGWWEVLVTVPIAVSLPLLPLVFPPTWLLLMAYGNARISALLQTDTHYAAKRRQKEPGSDPFDETEIDRSTLTVLDLAELKHHFVNELLGRGNNLTRSSNILHALGSITSLCCVDKKGILSWPNPTAEKIFFLRKKEEPVSSPSASSLGDVGCSSDTGVESVSNHESNANRPENKANPVSRPPSNDKPSQMQAEVLDLTHDHSCPFRLQFDDALWGRHLDSLKPLGLAILLNTCNMATQYHYTQFCSHVTCEALYNEDLVPVTNRRLAAVHEVSTLLSTNKCLCEVAKQIGFTEKAVQLFQLESQLSTFRHVEPESVRQDMRFAKSLPASTKLKFPFPHMVAVVVRDLTAQRGLQLFSQGTADIVLDSCTQYWDGDDICRLSPGDRRKVQDFYQRTSLSAYCTAFAYRPLFNSAAPALSSIYMELPTDSQHLYNRYNRQPLDMADLDALIQGHGDQMIEAAAAGGGDDLNSHDSMFDDDEDDEDLIEEVEINDIEGCFKLQCNQIFIGMVTMQYQAQADIVQLIEQLERACIRFVHFSKENELRSRVFSEKMGLESGWNCHISLLSERSSGGHQNGDLSSTGTAPDRDKVGPDRTCRADSGYHLCSEQQEHYDDCHLLEPLLNCGTLCSSRQMSMSAPCTYKPENEIGTIYEDDAQKSKDAEDGQASQQRNIGAGRGGEAAENWQWQSLSCLTDSTEQSVPVNFDMSNRLYIQATRNCNLGKKHLQRKNLCSIRTISKVNVAVEPLYPQVCQKVPVYQNTSSDRGPSPVDISKKLNSIPCSISMRRNEDLSLFHLIREARNFMMQAWNCTQFWICCVVSLSFTQLLAATAMLPPLLSTGQVLYLSIVFIPSLALSLNGTPIDKGVMQRATGKNNLSKSLNGEMALFVIWCYGTKFLPTVAIAPLLFAGLLGCYCQQLLLLTDGGASFEDPVRNSSAQLMTSSSPSPPGQCVSLVYLSATDNDADWGGWSQHPYTYLIAQQFVMILLSVHFITISSSFVHRDHLTWRRLPFTNKLWAITSLIILLLSALYALLALSLKSESQLATDDTTSIELEFTNSSPLAVLIMALVSPLLVLAVNELVKVNVRYQKRARLEFGTKLGMNSPF